MNYITILDFMVTDLKLKGNELIIFALIYGFSQDDSSNFCGSLTYIQNRTGLSRPTVVDILEKLVKKELILKTTEFRNNLKTIIYKTSKETLLGVVKFPSNTSKETLPPILYNTKDIKKDIYSDVDEDIKNKVTEIIKYLNSKTNKHFRVEAKSNRKPIEARLKEGFTVKDFIHVIDVKTQDWLHTDMNEYLCPETLFRSSKFEKYLNQKLKSISVTQEKNKLIEKEIFGAEEWYE